MAKQYTTRKKVILKTTALSTVLALEFKTNHIRKSVLHCVPFQKILVQMTQNLNSTWTMLPEVIANVVNQDE